MGLLAIDLLKTLEELEPPIRKAFIKILERLEQIIGETVKREDFLELKNIVKDLAEEQRKLAEAQRRTEEKVEALAEEQKKLAEAQRRTEERLEELAQEVKALAEEQRKLAEAQRRTEERLEELAQEVKALAEEQRKLAEAQRRTEERLEELAGEVKSLAEAQKKTEERLEALAEEQKKLAEAQRKTEEELRKLACEHRKTREGLIQLRKEFGGFTRSYAYAFENEAYRNLPKVLKEKYGIEVVERFVRTEIEDEEINFLAKGRVNGKEVVIVGEAKLRFDEKKRDFERTLKELERKEKVVKKVFGVEEVVKLIVTHFAKPSALRMAEAEGILVVQSFEW